MEEGEEDLDSQGSQSRGSVPCPSLDPAQTVAAASAEALVPATPALDAQALRWPRDRTVEWGRRSPGRGPQRRGDTLASMDPCACF